METHGKSGPLVPTWQNEHLSPSAAIPSCPVSTEGHSTSIRLVHGLAVSMAKGTLALPSAYHGPQSPCVCMVGRAGQMLGHAQPTQLAFC